MNTPQPRAHGIEVTEWRLPGGPKLDVQMVNDRLEVIPEALNALAGDSIYGMPARPYGHAVDDMAIYSGVQL